MNQKIILIAIFFSSLIGCAQPQILTDTETDLLARLNFDQQLATLVKSVTKTDIKQLPGVDRETGDIDENQKFPGFLSNTSEELAVDFVKKTKSDFRKKGYLIFVFEGNDDQKSIAVIKGTDDLDILRYRRTDGINYELESEDVVKKIAEWKSKYGLTVIGCGRPWVQIEFDQLPKDMKAFAKEVYAFCPDSVDQGVGTIIELKNHITEHRGIWLWWD